MGALKTVLVAHDDHEKVSQIRNTLKKISSEIEVLESNDSSSAFDEINARSLDLLLVEYKRAMLDGRRLLDSLEDLKPTDWPKATLAIADVDDRDYLNIDLPNLTYLRREFNDAELSAAISSLLQISAKKMQADSGFILPFIDATRNVLKTMASTDSEKEKIVFQRNKEIIDISGLITIVSPSFYGSMAISFAKETFLGIVSRMLGEDYTELSDDLKDAAAEICNQVFGEAKTKLNEKGHDLKMAIPTVVIGREVPHAIDGQCVNVRFKTDCGPFVIETVIK